MTAKPTPAQLKRAKYERIVASLAVPKNISIAAPQQAKKQPASGVFASV